MIGKSKLLKDLRMKSSIEREIAVLQFLHHPSIVQLQATMEIEKHICLLLEYVDGGELFDFVQQKCMMTSDDQVNEPLVQDLFLQLVTVVQWMHEQNVVHRDLKLENILLHYDQDGELKLKITDFGLARVIDPQQPILTTRCGSEEYTAPEIVQGIGYDGRLTDLWALGIILFAMLTGYLPFASRDGSSSSLFYQIMQAIVRWPKDIPISLQAKQVVQSILVRQPEKRKSLLSIQTLEWFQS
ncbi:kinase-like domain-containing protein [Cunninghamella echinulata]|nr:kinase-like domain-containing protein [Cunninghamella echinulata]